MSSFPTTYPPELVFLNPANGQPLDFSMGDAEWFRAHPHRRFRARPTAAYDLSFLGEPDTQPDCNSVTVLRRLSPDEDHGDRETDLAWESSLVVPIIGVIEDSDEGIERLKQEVSRPAPRAEMAMPFPDFLWQPPHPDAALLALCARLAEMQAEWQRLWTLTSDDWGMDDEPITEADRIWWHYNNYVWPGVCISEWDHSKTRHPDDVVVGLLDYHPITREGLQAKAVAIVALDDAASYGDMRNDGCAFNISLIRDVAGPMRMLVGEEAPK